MPDRRSRCRSCSARSPAPSPASCYAEMASTVPIAGSAYTYAYATLGELIAWIIGWDLILEYALGAVTVAIGWSGYVVELSEKCRHRGAGGVCRLAVFLRCRRPRVACDRRDHQRSGDAGDRRDLGAARRRHPRIRPRQRRDRRDQARDHRGVHRRGGAVREHRALGDGGQPGRRVHSAQCRSRAIRLERRAARRRRGVLRLYRLRRGLDGGAGGEESEARHADRHPRLACHLHHSLRRGRLRAHRDRGLRQAQRARSDRRRHRCRRACPGSRRSSNSASSSA